MQSKDSCPSFIKNSSPKKKFYQILVKFKPRSFSEFSLKIDFEFIEAYMEKVVPIVKPFKTIFYSKFFEPGKVLFGSVKVRTGLNFEFKSFKPFDRV
jgi:hypothetical protein